MALPFLPVKRLSWEKARSDVRGGYHAGFPFAQQPVAMAGHRIVCQVAQKTGDEDECVQGFVGPSQGERYAQGGIGALAAAIALDQDHGGESIRVKAENPEVGPAGFGLQGGESEGCALVPLQDEFHDAIAQIAYAIEKQDETVIAAH
jgi:hypothetical protein